MAEIGRQRQHVAADIPALGRQRAFERANCECVSKVMKAWPRLAWPGSEPDPPCQFDEDGREIDRMHGPASREHEQVFVGPTAVLPLPLSSPTMTGQCDKSSLGRSGINREIPYEIM